MVTDAAPALAAADEIFQVLRAARMAARAPLLRAHRDQVKATLAWNIEKGLALTGEQIAVARDGQAEIFRRFAAFLADGPYDVLALPTVQVLPFPVEQEWVTEINGEPMATYIDWMRSCSRITVTLHPAITVPAGLSPPALSPPAVSPAGLSPPAVSPPAYHRPPYHRPVSPPAYHRPPYHRPPYHRPPYHRRPIVAGPSRRPPARRPLRRRPPPPRDRRRNHNPGPRSLTPTVNLSPSRHPRHPSVPSRSPWTGQRNIDRLPSDQWNMSAAPFEYGAGGRAALSGVPVAPAGTPAP